MVSRPSHSRVGWSVIILAVAVAVATNLWLTRAVPLSEKASSGNTLQGVEGLPKAGPVADHSPVIRPACDRAGYGTQSSDGGPSVFNPDVSTRSATTLHRNDAGSYEFLAPRTWKLRKQGSISTLVGPGRDFVVSLAPGPVGGLPRAYDEFVELVGKTYGDVTLGKIDFGCAAGDLSVWLYGKGTNAAAAPFEFLAVMIERSSGRTVGAFGAWNPKTPQVRPLVRQVMKSFHAIPVRA